MREREKKCWRSLFAQYFFFWAVFLWHKKKDKKKSNNIHFISSHSDNLMLKHLFKRLIMASHDYPVK